MDNFSTNTDNNEIANSGDHSQSQPNESDVIKYAKPAEFQINTKINHNRNGTLEEVISQYLNNNITKSPTVQSPELHNETLTTNNETKSIQNSIQKINISITENNEPHVLDKDGGVTENNKIFSFDSNKQTEKEGSTENININNTRANFKRFGSEESTTQIQIHTITSSLNKDIRKIYHFKKDKLGDGHFGEVRRANRINEVPSKYYAIKSISKKDLTNKDLFDLVKEVEIISGGDHPNIIKFYETYHDKHYFHIVMELCRGRELFDRIVEEGRIREEDAVKIIMKILHAISYCHSRGVTHRDLKPENILFETKDENSEIKLIDFGGSRKYGNNEKMHTILGTPYYVAPEVLQGEYNEKCDIWSIGALCYMMGCGDPPFKGNNNNEIFQRVLKDEISYKSPKWTNISKDAKDFVKLCMNKNAALRPSAVQAGELNWFKTGITDRHSACHLNQEMLKNGINYHCKQKLKKMVLRYLITMLTAEQLHPYTSAFYAIDCNHKGTIHTTELLSSLQLCGIEATEEEITKIIKYADEGNKGSGDCTEFIMVCMDQKKGFTEKKGKAAYQYFDVNSSGQIEISDIKDALLRCGKKVIEESDLQKIIKEVTHTAQTSITFEEFGTIFKPSN